MVDLSKGEVLIIKDLNRFERNGYLVFVENVSDLWVHLRTNGSQNKSVAFIFYVMVWHFPVLCLPLLVIAAWPALRFFSALAPWKTLTCPNPPLKVAPTLQNGKPSATLDLSFRKPHPRFPSDHDSSVHVHCKAVHHLLAHSKKHVKDVILLNQGLKPWMKFKSRQVVW